MSDLVDKVADAFIAEGMYAEIDDPLAWRGVAVAWALIAVGVVEDED